MNSPEDPATAALANSDAFSKCDEKHQHLVEASRSSGRSLSFWSDFTKGLDDEAVATLAARAHLLPEDMPDSWASLQRDQREVASLFSQIDASDRRTMLHALRSLVELRAKH